MRLVDQAEICYIGVDIWVFAPYFPATYAANPGGEWFF